MRLPLCLLITICAQAPAAAAFVEAGKTMPRYALLKEGTHRYLRYTRDGDANTPFDIWSRTVRVDPDSGRLHITQKWDGPATRWLDSWFEAGTFTPISHTRIVEKDGKRTVEGFVCGREQVTGMADLAGNTQKNLAVALTEPTFNFETDIEMLQTLPLAEGYEAVVNFYHPGGSAPARYTFRLAGSDVIAGPVGPVECWRVTTDYNRPGTVSTFWFAKGTQQFVRQETPTPRVKLAVKTLID